MTIKKIKPRNHRVPLQKTHILLFMGILCGSLCPPALSKKASNSEQAGVRSSDCCIAVTSACLCLICLILYCYTHVLSLPCNHLSFFSCCLTINFLTLLFLGSAFVPCNSSINGIAAVNKIKITDKLGRSVDIGYKLKTFQLQPLLFPTI